MWGYIFEVETGFLSRSTPRIGQRPPYCFCNNWCRSVNVLSCRCVLNLEVNLQPPSMGVLVKGDWQLGHVSDGPCFRRH
jgi:hypothetical protein